MGKMETARMTPEKKQCWKLWLGLLIGAVVMGIAWLLWWYFAPPKTVMVEKIVEKEVVKEVPVELQQKKTGSEIIDIDGTWNLYKNYDFGFQMKIPKKFLHFNGNCEQKTEDGKQSYRPVSAIVPTKVFEDEGTVYITSEYYYKLTGEEKVGGKSYFAGCEMVENSLTLVSDGDNMFQQVWKIRIADVQDEDDVKAFIESEYSPDCELGELKPASQGGVFDVPFGGDQFSGCWINGMMVSKYYPEGNLFVNWGRGQAFSFCGDFQCQEPYDDEMEDSFEFLGNEE